MSTSTTKLSKEKHQKIIKDAFWHVLINVPYPKTLEENLEYEKSVADLTDAFFFVFIQNLSEIPQTPEFLARVEEINLQFFEYIDAMCTKSFSGTSFKQLKESHKSKLLYEGFRKCLTAEDLYLFYKSLGDHKPDYYCADCKRYSNKKHHLKEE
jgi:hypothetical protein